MMQVDVGDVLFALLNTRRVDEQQRFRIGDPDAKEDFCDIRVDLGQVAMDVKISFPMSDKTGPYPTMH
jgi:hypothetical protein